MVDFLQCRPLIGCRENPCENLICHRRPPVWIYRITCGFLSAFSVSKIAALKFVKNISACYKKYQKYQFNIISHKNIYVLIHLFQSFFIPNQIFSCCWLSSFSADIEDTWIKYRNAVFLPWHFILIYLLFFVKCVCFIRPCWSTFAFQMQKTYYLYSGEKSDVIFS